jgi:putative aldouronate transport system permease protein
MRSFIKGVPEAVIESAKIDGAGEFRIFAQIIVPLIPSGLATIGLFKALMYWNDWYHAMLFIRSESKYPLMYFLNDVLNRAQAISQMATMGAGFFLDELLPTFSLRMAMAVVAIGPIVFAYPFVQKYFIRGIAIGSVKG